MGLGVTKALLGSLSCLASNASFLVTTAFAGVPVSAFLLVAISMFDVAHNIAMFVLDKSEDAINLLVGSTLLHFLCKSLDLRSSTSWSWERMLRFEEQLTLLLLLGFLWHRLLLLCCSQHTLIYLKVNSFVRIKLAFAI